MVTDAFGSLLQELGVLIKLPHLKPDEHESCLIRFEGDLLVQLEVHKSGASLLIGTDLGSVPVGAYRENLFCEALKSNGLPFPRYGMFAYSKQADHLILFDMLPLENLNGAKIAEFLAPFLEKAKLWKAAISKTELPASTSFSGATGGGGIFGLKP